MQVMDALHFVKTQREDTELQMDQLKEVLMLFNSMYKVSIGAQSNAPARTSSQPSTLLHAQPCPTLPIQHRHYSIFYMP
jgi:hypothetical protein